MDCYWPLGILLWFDDCAINETSINFWLQVTQQDLAQELTQGNQSVSRRHYENTGRTKAKEKVIRELATEQGNAEPGVGLGKVCGQNIFAKASYEGFHIGMNIWRISGTCRRVGSSLLYVIW